LKVHARYFDLNSGFFQETLSWRKSGARAARAS
jgi:hypothetical protein